MIIARYITKEMAITFLTVLGVLLLVAISNRFTSYLAKAAMGELPLTFIFQLVCLTLPELLTYIIPLSFFIAILFAQGRLHADSEMVVLFASGMGWSTIVRFTLILSALLMLCVSVLSFWVVPKLSEAREKTLSQGEALAVIQTLLPGRFQTFNGGQLVVYLEDIAPESKTLKGIFIAEQPGFKHTHARGSTILTSDAAFVKKSEHNRFFLVLEKGQRYQGTPGQADYTVVQFGEYGRQLENPENTADVMQAGNNRQKTLFELWGGTSKEDQGELMWRLSLPLSIPILALIAIPLARVKPRFGRFAKFLPAILLFILYFNLFTIAKRYMVSELHGSMFWVWMVHLLFLGVGLSLLALASNFRPQFHPKFLKRI